MEARKQSTHTPFSVWVKEGSKSLVGEDGVVWVPQISLLFAGVADNKTTTRRSSKEAEEQRQASKQARRKENTSKGGVRTTQRKKQNGKKHKKRLENTHPYVVRA